MITKADPPLMGIGGISKATGVPVATIRTWERRYGFPQPQRLPSGHRRYSPTLIAHIRLISRALASGVKASTALALDIGQLRRMVDDTAVVSTAAVVRPPESETPGSSIEFDRLLASIRTGDDQSVERAMHRARSSRTLSDFLSGWVAPFLQCMGEAWHSGTLSVSDEHVAAERVRAFLVTVWRPMSDQNTGPIILLSALPDELHDLGLHMAACIVSSAGARVTFLGANVPLSDIASKASSTHASAVLISVSAAASPTRTLTAASSLRERLSDDIRLAVGGAGWTANVPGIENPPGLPGLLAWVSAVTQK